MRERELGPLEEPQLSLSAVPNGHLAVWDGRDGADVLHLAVPTFPPLVVSLSWFRKFLRDTGRVWLREKRRGPSFWCCLGKGESLSSSLDEEEAALTSLGHQKVGSYG